MMIEISRTTSWNDIIYDATYYLSSSEVEVYTSRASRLYCFQSRVSNRRFWTKLRQFGVSTNGAIRTGRLTCSTQYPSRLLSCLFGVGVFPLFASVNWSDKVLSLLLCTVGITTGLFITFLSLFRLPHHDYPANLYWWFDEIDESFPVSLPILILDVCLKTSMTCQFMFWSLIGSFQPMSKHWSPPSSRPHQAWKQTTNHH
jgi:hypothetical protein